MGKEKRRLIVGTDDWEEIQKAASDINVFGGTCDEDEPLATITIGHYIFQCLPGDVLIEYDDGTWDIIEKQTNQSRAITALAGKLS